ncbi:MULTISPECIES: tetratricopeptide repeat protein [unclassified Halomonas]|uniref:tetratricopeptide repeat protein n=1 Tax=unclassified Halomonas TaxID=2609666 RepID=UPI000A00E13A|nr:MULTISPECIES: tetratricopeptide repeat protein [unclassified Halomonas]MCO7215260.1 sel1 repeat family protein [Halomonas sp. OfavH-34-E]
MLSYFSCCVRMVRLFFVILVVSCFLVACDSCNDDVDVKDISEIARVYNPDPGPLALELVFSSSTPNEIAQKSDDENPYYVYLEGVLNFGNVTGHDRLRDEQRGVELLKKAWSLGVVEAGYSLFDIYYKGIGVCKNTEIALEYLEASAELGLVKSQRVLGHVYRGVRLSGVVEQDFSQSYYWYEKAAMQGDRVSSLNLAGLTHEGRGVVRNDKEAMDWLLKMDGMTYGDEMVGFTSLGGFYEEGIGTDIDLVQAYKYYDLLSPGSAPDKARLEEKMTPEQIREAIRLSREWQEEHNIYVPSYYGLEYQEDGTFQ